MGVQRMRRGGWTWLLEGDRIALEHRSAPHTWQLALSKHQRRTLSLLAESPPSARAVIRRALFGQPGGGPRPAMNWREQACWRALWSLTQADAQALVAWAREEVAA